MARHEVRLSMTPANRATLEEVSVRLGMRSLALQAHLLCAAWSELTGDVSAGRISAAEMRVLAGVVGRGDDIPDDLEDHEPEVSDVHEDPPDETREGACG